MKIRIRDIRSDGLELNQDVSSAELGLLSEEYVKFKDPIHIKAVAQKAENTVLVTMHVGAAFEAFCARCLEPIDQRWEKEFFFDFPVGAQTEFIELDDDIRQEMLVTAPARLLCKETCKGLCVGCGVNLNLEKCKCK